MHFHLIGTYLSAEWEDKKSKKYYDKYTLMLTIRDDHVDNHFSDKFVLSYYVGYFINGDGQKLTPEYIYHYFYTFKV